LFHPRTQNLGNHQERMMFMWTKDLQVLRYWFELKEPNKFLAALLLELFMLFISHVVVHSVLISYYLCRSWPLIETVNFLMISSQKAHTLDFHHSNNRRSRFPPAVAEIHASCLVLSLALVWSLCRLLARALRQVFLPLTCSRAMLCTCSLSFYHLALFPILQRCYGCSFLITIC
jgi:hypothetical protein